MDHNIFNIIVTILIILWPVLYFILWNQLGYVWQKRRITIQTWFYVDRHMLWKSLRRSLLYGLGIVMSLSNALFYVIAFYRTYGLDHAADKVTVIYLFLFGVCINVLYSSLMLGKHCFTKEEKPKRYQMIHTISLAIVIVQLLIVDGLILGIPVFVHKFRLSQAFGQFGLIGYILEVLILLLFLLFARLWTTAMKKSFLLRTFPR